MLVKIAVKMLGVRALVLFGDPAMYDRWLWIRRYLTPGKLRTFDAGAGSGAYALYAAALGNAVVGASFDQASNVKARERARMVGAENATFIDLDLRELCEHVEDLGQFDQVLCLETIEHILDDERLIEGLSQLLACGGRLLLTTNYVHRHRLPDETISTNEDGGHVTWGYTHEQLAEMFERHNLEVISTDYVTGLVSQKINSLARRLTPLVGHRLAWALSFPLRILQPADPLITRVTRYPSLCVGLVGVKR